MGLEAQIHVSTISMVDIVLVQHIIKTFIEVLQVKENNSSACLHADLNLVNIAAHLYKRHTHKTHHNAIEKTHEFKYYLCVFLVFGEATAKEYERLDVYFG